MDIIDHLQDEEEFLLNLKIESRRVKPVKAAAAKVDFCSSFVQYRFATPFHDK